MVKAVIALALFAAPAHAVQSYYSNNTQVLNAHFHNFVEAYGREYETKDEEKSRFAVFSANLKLIDERNAAEKAAGGHAEHGITRFSDLTEEEFKARYLLATPHRVQEPSAPRHVAAVSRPGGRYQVAVEPRALWPCSRGARVALPGAARSASS